MRPLANSPGRLGWGLLAFALAACGSESQPAVPAPEPRVVDMAQLEVAVQQNLGRGTLVNVWATW